MRPKPMVEIGGRPILWHIMKIYSAHGLNDFVVCLGYKGYMIKEYFANYFLHTCDVTFDVAQRLDGGAPVERRAVAGHARRHGRRRRMTGGRLKRVLPVRRRRGLLPDLRRRPGRRRHRALARVPPRAGQARRRSPPCSRRGRFGALELDGRPRARSSARSRAATAAGSTAASSSCRRGVRDYIDGDATVFEQEPLRRLAADGQLSAYEHDGFWQPMDTLREKSQLEELWERAARAPWKVVVVDASGAAGASSLTGHTGFKGAGWRSGSRSSAPRSSGSPTAIPTEPSLLRARGRRRRISSRSRATCATRTRSRAAVAEQRAESSSTSPRSRSCGARTTTRRAPSTSTCMGTVNLLEAVRARRTACASSST